MPDSFLFGLLILAPLVAGVLAYFTPGYRTKSTVVVVASVVTAILGLMAAWNGFCEPREMTLLAGVAGASWLGFGLEIALDAITTVIGLKIKSKLVTGLGIIQFILTLAAEVLSLRAHGPAEGLTLVLDPLSMCLVLVICIVGSAIVLYSIGYMKEHLTHAPPSAAGMGRFFLFLVGFLGAMNGLVLSSNLQWLIVFWEMTTLCSFFLIGHDGTEEARAAAKRAILINSLGGAAMMLAPVVALYEGGNTSLAWIMQNKALIPMALLCIAAFTKSAQLPFQSWLLGAMVAPTPVSALLHSATMVKAGSYLVLRMAPAFSGEKMMSILAVAGAFTFAITSALAVSQSNAKKVLAYSTIANLGLIVACAGINTPLSYAAGLMILCFHAVSKGLLFLCVGTIEQHIGSRDIEDMGGLMFQMPLTATIAIIGMLSMLVPPFGMLLSKWMAIEAAISSPLLVFLLALGSALTVFFWAKWLGRIQTVSFHTTFKIEQVPFFMSIINIFLGGMVVLAGIAAVPLYKHVFVPLAQNVYVGIVQSPANVALLDSIRELVVWPFFVVQAVAVVAWVVTFKKIKVSHMRLPFLCGENMECSIPRQPGDIGPWSFRGPKDAPDEAYFASYYLRGVFTEPRITFWGNGIAFLILLTMLGLVRAI